MERSPPSRYGKELVYRYILEVYHDEKDHGTYDAAALCAKGIIREKYLKK